MYANSSSEIIPFSLREDNLIIWSTTEVWFDSFVEELVFTVWILFSLCCDRFVFCVEGGIISCWFTSSRKTLPEHPTIWVCWINYSPAYSIETPLDVWKPHISQTTRNFPVVTFGGIEEFFLIYSEYLVLIHWCFSVDLWSWQNLKPQKVHRDGLFKRSPQKRQMFAKDWLYCVEFMILS